MAADRVCTPLVDSNVFRIRPRSLRADTVSGVFAAVLLAVVYAAFAPIARELGQGFTTLQQVYLRTILGAVIAGVLWHRSVLRMEPAYLSVRELSLVATRALFLTVVGAVAFSFSVQSTTISNAAFLGSLPLAIFWSWLIFGEKLNRYLSIALVAGMVGSFCILRPGLSVGEAGNIAGQVAAIICAASYSLGFTMRRLHSPVWNERGLGIVTLTMGGVLALLASIVTGEGIPAAPTPYALFILVVASTFVALAAPLAGYVFNKLSGARAGIILMIEIPLALAVGALIYGEVPSINEAFGGLLVLLSTATAAIGHTRQTRV